MEFETDYAPALTAVEYRAWMVAAFHDVTWHHALAALVLSTKDYAEQVAKIGGRNQLAVVLSSVMTYIRCFERDIAAGKNADASSQNLVMFQDAEKRLRSVVRFCLDNDVFKHGIQTPMLHPTEAIQTVTRDVETLEMTGTRTVYKFG